MQGKLFNIMNATILRNLTIAGLAIVLTACGAYPVREGSDVVQLSVVENAEKLLGTPYLFGGLDPSRGLDCSGLVYVAFRDAGMHVPRTSRQQYRATKRIRPRQLQPGDLVFFKLERDKISHVGIYVGENRFIHAPRTGKHVEYASLDNTFWKKRFSAAGRFSDTSF